MAKKKELNDEPQGETSGWPEFWKISELELKEILYQHEKWVETKKKEGKRANLVGANLQEANLVTANLQEANLGHANLQGAKLVGAKLQKAILFDTILRDANLQNADLTDVKGLMGEQLAGANVSGAKIPEDILEFEGLKIVAEASKNARKLFFGMLLGCVYSWLTIATTTDVRLLTNSASSPLPIIRTEIPIVGFFLIAPLILLSVYLYSHIYMQRLWEGLAKLPAVFPDGRALHERAYPWLLTGLVCAYFKLLKPNRPAMSRIQVFLSIILAWWIIPITLLLFWARFLPRHELGGTTLHVIMVVISIAAAIFLFRLAVSTVRGDKRKPFPWKKPFKDSRIYKRSAVVLGIVAIGIALLFFSSVAIEGIPPGYPEKKELIPESNPWAQNVLMYIGKITNANFFEANVSEKPPNRSETDIEDEPSLVKGARLKRRNLRHVNAIGAFLVNADLRGADLRDADLRWADLQDASLLFANLQEANLRGVKNLSVEELLKAKNYTLAYYDDDFLTMLELPSNHNENLKVKDFSGYNFSEANLREANLQEANLQGAHLQGADLQLANLEGVNNLSVEQLSGVKTLYKAKLDPELMEQVKKKYPHLLAKPIL